MKTIVLALGGNAILQRGQRGTIEEQSHNVAKTAEFVALLVKEGHRVVLTHGNGPQVGNIMVQNELAKDAVPPMPMDVCGAQSQGMIGYLLQMHIGNALMRLGLQVPVATIITRVLVDPNDPAFGDPSKPVGSFKSEAYARERMANYGETWIEDSGRGWRRVVPSPDPKEIVEGQSVKALVNQGHLVISTGGGGIPVIRNPDGTLRGIEAVIDKDLAAERLAVAVGASTLMILTDVDGVALYYGAPRQRFLREATLAEMEAYLKENHFKRGSMLPKVQAVVRFLRNGGEEGIIAALDKALEAARGETGTRVTR